MTNIVYIPFFEKYPVCDYSSVLQPHNSVLPVVNTYGLYIHVTFINISNLESMYILEAGRSSVPRLQLLRLSIIYVLLRMS